MSQLQLKSDECWFLKDKATCFVLDILQAHNGQAYVVGGAVRNIFFGTATPSDDIDITTDLHPERVQNIAQDNHIKIVASGIAHGTITWIIDGRAFEITTFRHDVQTDGRHAVVAFSKTKEEDAVRRDFTVNALYCDRKGVVHLPVTDKKDIAQKNISFIGNASQRIEEDYLRILRYLRFVSLYGLPNNFDNVCKDIIQTIQKIFKRPSAERNFSEFKKMVVGEYFQHIIPYLHKYQLLEYFFECPLAISCEIFSRLIKKLQEHDIQLKDYMWVSFLFAHEDIVKNETAFRFSRAEKRDIYKICDLCQDFQNAKDIYEIFSHQYEYDDMVFYAALMKYIIFCRQERADILFDMTLPECDISAKVLIEQGINPKDLKTKIKAMRYDNLRLEFPNLKNVIL